MEEQSMFASAPSGERLNQLGGSYRNGKPLSSELRQQVIKMSMSGIRPCEISRRLKVTHGCISKLLSKFYKTGSMNPGHGTAGRPRVITPRIEEQIERYRKEQPGIFSWEIRERLLREKVCTQSNLPSLSSISRLVKNKIKQKVENTENHPKNSVSFSISKILSGDFDKPRQRVSPYSTYPSIYCYDRNHSKGMYIEDVKSLPYYNNEIHKDTDDDEQHRNPDSENRKRRIRFSDSQLGYMKKAYDMNPYPSHEERDRLSKMMGVDEARIQVWFSNRRAKAKRSLPMTDNTDVTQHVTQHVPTPLLGASCHSWLCCGYYCKDMSYLHGSSGTSRLFFPSSYGPASG